MGYREWMVWISSSLNPQWLVFLNMIIIDLRSMSKRGVFDQGRATSNPGFAFFCPLVLIYSDRIHPVVLRKRPDASVESHRTSVVFGRKGQDGLSRSGHVPLHVFRKAYAATNLRDSTSAQTRRRDDIHEPPNESEGRPICEDIPLARGWGWVGGEKVLEWAGQVTEALRVV